MLNTLFQLLNQNKLYRKISAIIIVLVLPLNAYPLPDGLQFKFESNPTQSTVYNCAWPRAGLHIAPLNTGMSLTSGGQFDTCISSSGLISGISTGWNCDLGSSSWTISMWISIPSMASGSAYYLFGDAGSGSFRCFHNGVAGQDNLVLRGNFPDVTVSGIGPLPTVVTFVYDSSAAHIRAYKNALLVNTISQVLNLPQGSGFKIGGYGTSTSFIGKLDEFRLWRKALTQGEIDSTWNVNIICADIINPVFAGSITVPSFFDLSQNYPNPFNPTTVIKYGLPKAGNVKLTVYDILGSEVGVLVNEYKQAGIYNIGFDGSTLASGVYFYKLEAGDFIQTKKMLLIK